ncbi:MAG: SDR family NAD(P)-dependent oxidoreductase [Actinomycetota bacterium]
MMEMFSLTNQRNESFPGQGGGDHRGGERDRKKAIAEAFARRGAALALADIDAEGLEKTREELEARGTVAREWTVDVSDAGQVKRFCDEVYHRFGRVDVLCNNAGASVGGRFEDITLDDWGWIVGVNLWGVLHGCLYFYPRMVAQGRGGHIVNAFSGLALAPLPGSIPYCTTKYGVVGFSETPRADAARHGVGSLSCAPGSYLPAFSVHRARVPWHRGRPTSNPPLG